MNSPMLKLKLVVTETPVINGFSYPFLRILTTRAHELKRLERLFKKENGMAQAHLTEEAQDILSQIAVQLLATPEWATTGYVNDSEKIFSLIDRAEAFLKNFVATDKELREMSRATETL